MISLVPFRTFRWPLFPKPDQELFFTVSYSKLALVGYLSFHMKYSDLHLKDNSEKANLISPKKHLP